jgi:hypothetical protein
VTRRAVRYGEIVDGVRHAEYFQLVNAQACFIDAEDGEFDIVHNHAGIEGLVLGATSSTPVLTTNHNPYLPATRPAWDAYPWAHNSLSASSAATFPSEGAVAPIHHGIDVASFPFGERPSGDLLFLGRFAPEKGADRAIEAARLAGRRLVLAGKVDAADAAHFAEAIEPQIDGDLIRYVGEVDGVQKRQLLADARALLFPDRVGRAVRARDDRGDGVRHAVLGLRRASVPEVVEPGSRASSSTTSRASSGRSTTPTDRPASLPAPGRAALRRRAMVDDYERTFAEVIESAAGERELGQRVG